jgi:hypothetical protein
MVYENEYNVGFSYVHNIVYTYRAGAATGSQVANIFSDNYGITVMS